MEATIILPIFFLAMASLLSFVPTMATFENITYGLTEELRLETAKASLRKNPAALPTTALIRVKQENPSIQYLYLKKFRYLYEADDREDLIVLDVHATVDSLASKLLNRPVAFECTIVGRAYTGTYYNGGQGDGVRVYIFPDYGEHYHKESCRYLASHCEQKILSAQIQKKYRPCPLCHAKQAEIGSTILIFETSGEAYHTKECKSVERYYVETNKGNAQELGYKACRVCGGS